MRAKNFGIKVTFKHIIKRRKQRQQKEKLTNFCTAKKVAWGDAIDVSVFSRRTAGLSVTP